MPRSVLIAPSRLASQACTLALVFIAIAGSGPITASASALAVAAVTPALVVTDVAEQRLPNRLVAVALAGTLLSALLASLRSPGTVVAALATGLSVGLFLLLLSVGGGLGMGDVKLGAVLATSLALASPLVAVAGLALAFLAGGVSALAALATRGTAARIPFGPHLLAAYWVALVLWGRG